MRLLLRTGRLVAPYYSPRGQEAISAAMAVNLNDDDYYVTIYRGLHDHLAKGVPLKPFWAEYYGRSTGSCKGKGGPMHITHPAMGVMVTTGIVGGGIPIATGLAWASQLKKDGRVTVTNFGDGATNIGAFHEGMNLAAVWKLPVIFLCHNNQYSEHTKLEDCTAVRDIATRATAYDMPGVIVDGNDALALWEVCREAVERARAGGGPTLIEAKTFRYHGHNMGDPGDYISKEEMDGWLAKDPYPRIRSALLDSGYASEADILAIDAQIEKDLDEAIEFASNSPYPEPDELGLDIYDEELAI